MSVLLSAIQYGEGGMKQQSTVWSLKGESLLMHCCFPKLINKVALMYEMGSSE